jgi:hypothetical protein
MRVNGTSRQVYSKRLKKLPSVVKQWSDKGLVSTRIFSDQKHLQDSPRQRPGYQGASGYDQEAPADPSVWSNQP